MTSWYEVNRRAADFWFRAMTAQVAAATTIAARTAILSDTTTPSRRRRSSREAKLMVAEKLEAATEGARRAALAALATPLPALGRMPDALSATNAALRIGQAMFEPARRRVEANAARLTRR